MSAPIRTVRLEPHEVLTSDDAELLIGYSAQAGLAVVRVAGRPLAVSAMAVRDFTKLIERAGLQARFGRRRYDDWRRQVRPLRLLQGGRR